MRTGTLKEITFSRHLVLYVSSDVITTWGGSFSVESAKKQKCEEKKMQINESAKKKSSKERSVQKKEIKKQKRKEKECKKAKAQRKKSAKNATFNISTYLQN
jgi:predicted Holliday junction resolvase-like endonuclease